MKNSAFEPLAKRVVTYREGLSVKAGRQEICSFTLEKCLINDIPGEKEYEDQLCPFTLEPLCMKTRALSAARD